MKIVNRVSRIIITIAGKIVFRIISCLRIQFRPLTISEREFIEINSVFWKGYMPKQKVDKNKYLFVVPELYPLILIGNAHISSFIALQRNLKLLFLIPSRFDRSMKKVLSSFPNSSFIYEDSWRYLFFKIYSYFQARKAMCLFKDPEDVLNFKVDGIQFGGLIYDSFLSSGFATMKDVKNNILLDILKGFFYQRSVICDIIKRFRIDTAFVGHIIGIFGGVHMRYLLNSNIEVWVKENTLKKYHKIEQVYECCTTPDKRYINFMSKHMDYFIPFAEQCLKNRLEGQNTEVANLPYLKNRRIFRNKEEFCDYLRLSLSKKNIFVMLHAFNDYPHTYGFLIHRDYYEWFKEVLEITQSVDSVNWIFKEHPYAKYYPTKDVDLDALFSNIRASHIRFLNKDANFNTSSLRYIADGIVTCIGSAGLEYSAFGIPCVLAGRVWYSGFGFAIEPQTDAEFKRILKNINTLPRLSSKQINIAKIIAFFVFEVIDVTKFSDPFKTIPTFNSDEMIAFSSEQIFERIVEHRLKTSLEEKNKYIRAIREFILNPNFIQFIDLARYNIFNEVINL